MKVHTFLKDLVFCERKLKVAQNLEFDKYNYLFDGTLEQLKLSFNFHQLNIESLYIMANEVIIIIQKE